MPTTGGEPPGDERPPFSFEDDFDRGTEEEIGNGWEEETPDLFSLDGGAVVGQDVPNVEYFDSLVSQQGRNHLEIAVRAEFEVTGVSDNNEPFIFARAQPTSFGDTTAQPTPIHGYVAVANAEPMPGSGAQGGWLCIIRFGPGDFSPISTPVWCAPMAFALDLGVYRLGLRVSGTDPVELLAVIERFDEGTRLWEMLGFSLGVDEQPERIAVAGLWGFGGGESPTQLPNYRYLRFDSAELD